MLRRFIMLIGLLIFNSSVATTVLPVSLDSMAQTAEVIFYGRVLSNEVRIDDVSQRVATFTTFEVLDPVKGVNTDTYTLKQIGGQLPDSPLVVRIYGVPRFNENQEYVVFLPQASRLGFASPIGLSQGSYSVNTHANGKTVHQRNSSMEPPPGRAISDTAKTLRTTSTPHNETPLVDFLQQVRSLSGQ